MLLDFEMFGRISAEQLVSVDAKLSKRSGVERKQLSSVHRPITPHCAPCAARDGSIIPFFPSPNQIQVPPTSHIAICEVDSKCDYGANEIVPYKNRYTTMNKRICLIEHEPKIHQQLIQ